MTQQPTLLRKDAPLESTWDVDSVFPSWDGWQSEFEALKADLPALTAFAGRLAEGPAKVATWLEAYSAYRRRALRLQLYPYMHTVVDTNDVTAKGKLGQASGLMAQFGAATAFAEPELMALGDRLREWAQTEPGLALYAHYFDDLLRQKAHRRSGEVEEILGMLSDPFRTVFQTFSELTNSDLKFADATDSQGAAHPVRQTTLPPTGIQSRDRTQRRTAWESFSDGHMAMQNTLASNYITHVKQSVFTARARKYDSVLASMLEPFNTPLSVFHTLLETFQKHLPVWHRYWEAKRRILGVETIHPWDIWAPMASEPVRVEYRQAVEWLIESLRPLGSGYTDVLRLAAGEERWVDWSPNAGKRQGAQSLRAKNIHPFLWLSYQSDLPSASFLAHELGHSMHSHFADSAQPELYADYSMTAAETASNFNQALLRAYLLAEKPNDANFQLALIDEAMITFHRYFFIMPTLARFELAVYTQAEKSQPLTAHFFNDLCADLFAEGYGDALTDDRARTASTWSQFLHLYMPYYTFQYSVGISAAHAIAEGISSGAEGAAERYLGFLSAGSSLYPKELFALAGVDLTSPEPVEKTFAVLGGMVERLEGMTG
ncbi:MAG: oligoendopeptidase F [Caldilineaceae bacterium]|nr:oligoendopeptidase F [Caldilineaceae bacterium]HRJ41388.1 oligoendopeptidase F [Caldilineaceae bacterium]